MCIFSGFQYGILNKIHGEIQIRQGLVQKFVVVRAAPRVQPRFRLRKMFCLTTKRRNFGVGNRMGELAESQPLDTILYGGFASKVGRQRGMRSVPPRSSGWVGDRHANSRGFRRRPVEPTRYRVVVLTSCHVDDRVLRQSQFWLYVLSA